MRDDALCCVQINGPRWLRCEQSSSAPALSCADVDSRSGAERRVPSALLSCIALASALHLRTVDVINESVVSAAKLVRCSFITSLDGCGSIPLRNLSELTGVLRLGTLQVELHPRLAKRAAQQCYPISLMPP